MAFFYVITYFILLYIILFDFFYETKNKQTNKLTLEVRQVCQNYAAAAAKSLQSCPTLQPHRRQPTRLPSLGFSRQEHWSGLPFPSPVHESETWKWSRSVVSDSATPWTAAHQAPPSTGFSRQEYWSGVPLPSPVKSIYSIYSPKRESRTSQSLHILVPSICPPDPFPQ